MAANNLVNTKMDLIAALVQKELTAKASILPYISDFSSMAMKGYKSLELPKLSQFTVQNRVLGAAVAENAALTDSTDVINFDQHPIVLFGYDSHDEYQSSLNYMQNAIERATTAHARNINDLVIAGMIANAGLDLGSVADITLANILTMREFILDNDGDASLISLQVGADQERAILEIPQFSEYQYRGDGAAPVVGGVIGRVYGIPVVLNTRMPAGQAVMVEKSGYGFAFSKDASVDEQKEVTYGSGGRKVAVDADWGHAALLTGEGSAAATKSPYVAVLA